MGFLSFPYQEAEGLMQTCFATMFFTFVSWPYSTILERDWQELKGAEGILKKKEVGVGECRGGKPSE